MKNYIIFHFFSLKILIIFNTGNANGNDSWCSYNSPEDAAYWNASQSAYDARKQYGIGPFSKAKQARDFSTYKNGRWSYDPSKFDNYNE